MPQAPALRSAAAEEGEQFQQNALSIVGSNQIHNATSFGTAFSRSG